MKHHNKVNISTFSYKVLLFNGILKENDEPTKRLNELCDSAYQLRRGRDFFIQTKKISVCTRQKVHKETLGHIAHALHEHALDLFFGHILALRKFEGRKIKQAFALVYDKIGLDENDAQFESLLRAYHRRVNSGKD